MMGQTFFVRVFSLVVNVIFSEIFFFPEKKCQFSRKKKLSILRMLMKSCMFSRTNHIFIDFIFSGKISFKKDIWFIFTLKIFFFKYNFDSVPE